MIFLFLRQKKRRNKNYISGKDDGDSQSPVVLLNNGAIIFSIVYLKGGIAHGEKLLHLILHLRPALAYI